MQKSTQNLLRWIAVLPGAILGGILATFPLHWILLFLFDGGETDLGSLKFFTQILGGGVSYEVVEQALYPFVIAFVYILAGTEIAPQHKFKSALALVSLYVVFAVGTLILVAGSGLQISLETRTIGPILGLALGLYCVRLKFKQDPSAFTSSEKDL